MPTFSFDKDAKIWVPDKGLVSSREFIQDWEFEAGLKVGDEFVSQLPPASLIEQEFAEFGVANISPSEARLMFDAAKNLHDAMNLSYMKKAIRAAAEGWADIGGGVLTEYLPAIQDLAKGGLAAFIGNESSDDFQEMLVDTAFMTAIKLLSKIPVVGQILAALVAVGFMFVKIFKYNADQRKSGFDQETAIAEAKLLSFPVGDEDTDAYYMNNMLLNMMQYPDWTSFFLPRYDWNQPWVARRYEQGMGFAPGTPGSKYTNGDFVPGTYKDIQCLGFIPGTQQITGMIEVLSPTLGQESYALAPSKKKRLKENKSMWNYLAWNGPFGIQGWKRAPGGKLLKGEVVDFGDYFPSCAQLLTTMWAHFEMDGNPDLYRIDTRVMDTAWRRYCDGAMDYVKETASWDEWGSTEGLKSIINSGGKDFDGAGHSEIQRSMAAMFACGIPCVLGSWRCKEDSFALRKAQDYRTGFNYEYCATNFNSYGTEAARACREGDMYTDSIKGKLRAIRKRQKSMLKHSLVCVYVHSEFAAFGDDELGKLLYDMRELFLTRKDQWRYLVEQDVPRNEVHNGQNWYNLLKSKGAFSIAYRAGSKTSVSAEWGTYDRGEAKRIKPRDLGTRVGLVPGRIAPPVGIGGRVPGEEFVPDAGSRPSSGKGGSSAPLLIGIAALAFLFMKNRR